LRGFAERVALVAGGARGISRAVALQLAYEGAYVIIGYPSTEGESESVTRELREIGTLAHAFPADVSRSADVNRLFAEIEGLYGRLDLLVNCASLKADATLAELTEEAWDEMMSVNLKSVFLCTQAAARLMRQRPKGAIVNLATDTSLNNNRYSAGYVAAQAGIIGLTKAFARELAPRIRVNCVAVRAAEQRHSSLDAEQQPQASITETNERREASVESEVGMNLPDAPAPDEVARACVYLLSSDAASITGQTLTVGTQAG
jgi:3-oxoacyl-[acyl-carrier protein] reductase